MVSQVYYVCEFTIPVRNSVGTYRTSAGDTLSEVRVNGRSRHRLETLQLPRCSHVEPLDHVVNDSDRNYHCHEYRRRETDHEQRTQHLQIFN